MGWSGRRVLVTGAGGFIASHLVERLVVLGARVKAMVRYNSREDHGMLRLIEPRLRKEVEVLLGDLRDEGSVREAVKGSELVFHLAALVDIPYSYLHSREVVETNVLGTANLLKAAVDLSVEYLIHTSTSEVYGTAQTPKIDETHPLVAQSPYAASKIGADKLAESFYRTYGLPLSILRPFNTYGPRQSARAVIPTIILEALTGPELILGSLYPTRDFTFISDIVTAFIKSAEVKGPLGQAVNVGSGEEIPIGDLARRILKLMGKDLPIRTDPARVRPRESEVERLCCDFSRAKEILGWKPEVQLDDGLTLTIRWFEANLNLYR